MVSKISLLSVRLPGSPTHAARRLAWFCPGTRIGPGSRAPGRAGRRPACSLSHSLLFRPRSAHSASFSFPDEGILCCCRCGYLQNCGPCLPLALGTTEEAGAACDLPGQLSVTCQCSGSWRLISLVCRNVTSPESRPRWPSRGESARARRTLHRHALDCVRSQQKVGSFQFCNLARWGQPGFDTFL